MRHLCYHMIGHVTCSSRPFHAVPDLSTNLDTSRPFCHTRRNLRPSDYQAEFVPAYLQVQFALVILPGAICASQIMRRDLRLWDYQAQFTQARRSDAIDHTTRCNFHLQDCQQKSTETQIMDGYVHTHTGRYVRQLYGHDATWCNCAHTWHILHQSYNRCCVRHLYDIIQLEPTIIQLGATCAHILYQSYSAQLKIR